MIILGVDPGASGALALLVDGELAAVEDTPVIDKRVNAAIVDQLLADWKYTHGTIHMAVIENVHAMPKQGVSSSFNFGRALGVVEGVILAAGIPTAWAPPAMWKRSMGLAGKPKGASRQLATDLWPTWADTFKRSKDDGRAEAALLAKYGEGLWVQGVEQ